MKNERNNKASPLESLVVFTKSDWDFHQSFINNLIEMERYKQYEEDLVAVFDLFRLLAVKRFPDIRFGWELKAACDIEGLRQLAHELDDLPTPEALRLKLVELAVKEN
ncbi:MAG: hypothetical protein ACREBD_17255 [Blastocatellia bacterium]